MRKILNIAHRVGRVAVKEMTARISNDGRQEILERKVEELQSKVATLQKELQEERRGKIAVNKATSPSRLSTLTTGSTLL